MEIEAGTEAGVETEWAETAPETVPVESTRTVMDEFRCTLGEHEWSQGFGIHRRCLVCDAPMTIDDWSKDIVRELFKLKEASDAAAR